MQDKFNGKAFLALNNFLHPCKIAGETKEGVVPDGGQKWRQHNTINFHSYGIPPKKVEKNLWTKKLQK